MAKSFLTDINLNNNVLQRAKIEAWGTAPTGTTNPNGSGTAVAGQISSYNGALYIYSGSAWGAVGGGSVTIGSTSVSVNGSAVTTFTGLSSVTSTTFVGALTGNASTATALATARTINGTSFDGSANITITANTTNALTIGSGLTLSSGTTFNGSSALTLTLATALPSGTTATTQSASDNSTKVATTAYVDSAVSTLSSGVNAHDAVKYATTAALGTTGNLVGGTITTTYNNNTTGVGATLTIASSSTWTSITIDGQSLTVGDRVLIKNQSAALQNGIYTVTTVGTLANSTSFVFTRATDNDATPELGQGDLTYVLAGTSNGGNSFVQTAVVATVGTDSITWSQFSGPGTYTFSSPISMSSNTVSLASGYGDTQNPYGSKTANYFLAAPNGSAAAPSFRAIVSADIPTLNQNTTGSAATLTTSRSLWGQTFNGSADVTGSLTSVANITGSAGNSMTITSATSGNGSLTLAAAGTGSVSITTANLSTAGPGSISLTGGNDTSTAIRTGGSISLTAGNGNSTQGVGGSVTINGGSGSATNGNGSINIGTANTDTVTIGASGKSVALPALGTSGFVKVGAGSALSSSAIAFSDLPTSSLTSVTTTGIARKTSGAGTGTGTSISVNHGYGQWVHAQLFDSSGNLVEVDVQNTSTSNGTTIFTFASSQTLTNYTYVIIG